MITIQSDNQIITCENCKQQYKVHITEQRFKFPTSTPDYLTEMLPCNHTEVRYNNNKIDRISFEKI